MSDADQTTQATSLHSDKRMRRENLECITRIAKGDQVSVNKVKDEILSATVLSDVDASGNVEVGHYTASGKSVSYFR